ncbi:MAG TPA: TetR/AcrR family transcriptional regulator [Ilumatobacteraceae bacterium]|nr:TetR/AcrR family transcriptional regulator [Ilumatobacteraceae bacterium]
MARTADPHLKRELLDQVVAYLAEHGLAQTTLRPMAAALGVSINRLMHHFGSKDELITAALARAIDVQIDVQRKWLQRTPRLTQVELYRRWWKWLCASPSNLALVRLNYEAATLEPAVTGLAGDVRADQIGVWRHDVEQRLVAEGLKPERAALEASLIKATFTGLAMDLFATGDTRRLTKALDSWLSRLSKDLRKADEPQSQRTSGPSDEGR